MPLREECLWEKLTPQRPDNSALKGEVTVDVCVIGAGSVSYTHLTLPTNREV